MGANGECGDRMSDELLVMKGITKRFSGVSLSTVWISRSALERFMCCLGRMGLANRP